METCNVYNWMDIKHNRHIPRHSIKNLSLRLIAIGDIGAAVGSFVGGSIMAGAFAETGPGAAYAGVWGAIVGGQLGREAFRYIGEAYYDICVVSRINKQLQELIRYNRINSPIIYP